MKLPVSVVMVCLVLAVSYVQAARVKLQLTKESAELYRAHIFKRQTNGGSCDDNMVVERTSLTLPGRLNDLDPRVKFYRSATVTSNLDVFQNMLVPGLEGLTVRDVLTVLRNESCATFFFGGAVRDQYLNKQPDDADILVDCSIDRFYNVCVQAWGPSNCQTTVSFTNVGHVGNETVDPSLPDVDLVSTDFLFYAPIATLEYTMNSMAYDLNGLDVVIDVTGTGQVDACNGHIRIPSDDGSIESWNDWVDENKAFRFWKLRTKGLVAYNNATLDFIVTQSQQYIQSNPDNFADFYCSQVYGADYDAANKKCDIPESACEGGNAKAALYNATFAEDFGDYWNDQIIPNVLPSLADCLSGGDGGAIPTEYSVKVLAGLIFIAFLSVLF